MTEIKRNHQKKTLKLADLTERKRLIEEKKMKALEREKMVNKPLHGER